MKKDEATKTGGIKVKEAALRLGVPTRGPYIYRWIKQGKIRVVSEGERKPGRGMLVSEEDVARLQKERKRELVERASLVENPVVEDENGIKVIEAAPRLGIHRPNTYRAIRDGRIKIVRDGERRKGCGMLVDEEDVRKLQEERRRMLLERAGRIGG